MPPDLRRRRRSSVMATASRNMRTPSMLPRLEEDMGAAAAAAEVAAADGDVAATMDGCTWRTTFTNSSSDSTPLKSARTECVRVGGAWGWAPRA